MAVPLAIGDGRRFQGEGDAPPGADKLLMLMFWRQNGGPHL